jgi:hypothetical protein
MHILGRVDFCDFENKSYFPFTEGIHFFARGATGRVCWVMSMGPDCEGFQKYKETAVSVEQLEAWAEDYRGGWLDY